jgi:hypothetical protein
LRGKNVSKAEKLKALRYGHSRTMMTAALSIMYGERGGGIRQEYPSTPVERFLEDCIRRLELEEAQDARI